MLRAVTRVARRVPSVGVFSRGLSSEVQCYYAGDKGQAGVILIHEWWGVNDEMKEKAEMFADRGFRVAVPDMFGGKSAEYYEQKEAEHFMNNLDFPGAVKHVATVADLLRAEGSKKVGVSGFCMGGALTLASCVLVPTVNAGAAFYGIPPDGLADCSKMPVPVIGHFGGKDTMAGFSDYATADALANKLEESGADYRIYKYDQCDHAFTNSQRPEVYNEEAAAQALDRTYSFFIKHLK